MTTVDTVTKEPIDRIVTVSKLVQLLEKFPPDMLVFVKNQAGDYSTAITLNETEEGDLEVNSL
jgi:hypothetical protein